MPKTNNYTDSQFCISFVSALKAHYLEKKLIK